MTERERGREGEKRQEIYTHHNSTFNPLDSGKLTLHSPSKQMKEAQGWPWSTPTSGKGSDWAACYPALLIGSESALPQYSVIVADPKSRDCPVMRFLIGFEKSFHPSHAWVMINGGLDPKSPFMEVRVSFKRMTSLAAFLFSLPLVTFPWFL